MATTILKNIKEAAKGRPSQHLINSIKYIMNPDKTEGGLWVGSNAGVTPDEIYDCMMSTKKEYGKENGRQGYHYVISFPPGACDEATCFKVGKEFCEAYFGDGYEYVFAVHNDHEHMHCHIVFNSVGRMDGSKYRYVNGDWEKYIQPVTDKITEKYGLGRLEYDKSSKRKGKSYAEHSAGKADKFTWKKIIRLDIDMAVSVSNNLHEYFEEMRRMGYDIRIGQSEKHGDYISYHHPAMKEVDGKTSKRARRDYNLGPGYTFADIKRRIMQPDKDIIPPDDFFVIPSSIHEVITLPVGNTILSPASTFSPFQPDSETLQSIMEMVSEVNETLEDEEILGYSVSIYDADKHELEKGTEYCINKQIDKVRNLRINELKEMGEIQPDIKPDNDNPKL